MGDMTKRKRLAAFTLGGALFGFLGSNPDDTQEVVENTVGGAIAGAAVGVLAGAGDKIHSKIKPKPSKKELAAHKRYADEKEKVHWREAPERRREKQREDDDHSRGR